MNSHILQTSENTLTKIMLLKGILLIGILAALLFHPAEAQTLKQTGVSIFNALYAVIGVVGAICVLVTGINWAAGNFLGAHDPKRLFFQVLAGTAIAFASVAIVQFIKEAEGGNGSIGNL